MGWFLFICGCIGVGGAVLDILLASGHQYIYYTDIDGQKMSLDIGSNTIFTCSLIKIICGALTIYQGKITKKVFQPILKEYKDAERGVTQGIQMNKRRSKEMAHLKKIVWKITGISCVVGLIAMKYGQSVMMDFTDQWIDQKYMYIAQHNTSDQLAYSVDKMQKDSYYNYTIDTPETYMPGAVPPMQEPMEEMPPMDDIDMPQPEEGFRPKY